MTSQLVRVHGKESQLRVQFQCYVSTWKDRGCTSPVILVFSWTGDVKKANEESHWDMDESKLKICQTYSAVSVVKLTFEFTFMSV